MNSFAQKVITNTVLHYMRLRIKTIALVSPKQAALIALKLFTTPRTRSTRSLKVPLLQQAQCIAINLNEQTANLYYMNNNATQKILLVHGWEADSGFWRHYFPLLATANYDVYALDALAHGLSTGSSTNAIEYQALVTKVLTEYGPFDAIMAHSMGTLVSSFAAVDAGIITTVKLVYISPAPYSLTHFNALKNVLLIPQQVMNTLYALVQKRYGMIVNEYSIYTIIKNNPQVHLCIMHDTTDVPCPIAETRSLLALNAPNVVLHETTGLGHNKIAQDNAVSTIVMQYLSQK